jgi:hypothetical protein
LKSQRKISKSLRGYSAVKALYLVNRNRKEHTAETLAYTLEDVTYIVLGLHTMSSISCSTAFEAPHKWVRTTRGPHAVEFGRIPHSLKGNLWHTNRVRRGAFRRAIEAFRVDGVVHVAGVVR